MTYANAADKYINNHANATGTMVDDEGNYYYVSHPPLAYYFPYAVFKLLHIRPAVLPLQVFNMLFHLIAALFVYFTVCLLSFNRARSYLHFPSLVAYTIYLFLPATLWFQGNVYMSDMAVHLPFVIGVYITLKMIIRQKFYVPKYIFWYALNLFIMLYTSWLGLFFVFGVVVYSLLHVRDTRGFRVLIWVSVLLAFFTIRLIIYQYSQINGIEAYIHELFNRYLLRGSVGELHEGFLHFLLSYFILFKNILYNYLANYLPIYILLAGFVWISITKAKLKIVFSGNGYRFLWLSILPIVLMHLVFLHYSSHDFTVLYASLFFSVLVGILYDKVKKAGVFSVKTINGLVLLTIAVLIAQFYITNPPGSRSMAGVLYSTDQTIGNAIKTQTMADEVVFMNLKASPQTVFYAGRNILQVGSKEEAMAFLKKRQIVRGAYFEITDDNSATPITKQEILNLTP